MTTPIRPAPCFAIERVHVRIGDRVRVVLRTDLTGGPKGLALFTAEDGRPYFKYFRAGDWT